MRIIPPIIVIAFLVLISANSVSASNIEGTNTYKDYIFVLVHGLSANEGIFEGKTSYGNLKRYLEENMALKGRVFAYTFNDPNGSNYDHARELGDRNYQNPGLGMNRECWLQKAREDFASANPGVLVPSKYILIVHSMGNLGVRAYVYSDKVFGAGKGFYHDDVAKAVFIAPPMLGSDNVMAMFGLWGRAGVKVFDGLSKSIEKVRESKGLSRADKVGDISSDVNGALKISDFYYEANWDQIWDILMSPGNNPFNAYLAGAIVAGWDIWGDSIFRMNGFGYNSLKPWWPGMIDMIPPDFSIPSMYTPLTMELKEAKLADSTKEPAYSIIYGRGIPGCDWKLTLGMAGIKTINESVQESGLEEASLRGYDSFIKYNNLLSYGISLNYGLLSLPLLGRFPTNQGKMLSFTLETILNAGFMTNDGDGLVSVYSARGDMVTHLKNASRYEHVFKTEHYEKYLSEQLPLEVEVTEAGIAIAAGFAAMGGTPYIVAWRNLWPCRIPVAMSLVFQTFGDINGLQYDVEAHGHILEQYDLIRTAILDSPAIFTVNDFQATTEVGVSAQVAEMSFSADPLIPSGLESIKVKGVTENRGASGMVSLPVPMTLKVLTSSDEGDRKYVTQMTLTRPPKRIAGKLNYLVPKLMRSFEYSFNFAAWKPIEGVNPETGEFVLENLPFAEGQNVLAIRAENAVGVKSSQLLKITLNTIPLLPTNFQPMPNYYISDTNPNISIEFNKSEYTGSYEAEQIDIKSMEIDGVAVEPQVESKMESYHPWAKATYKTPSDKPLGEGEHQVVVRAESNVGVSQGIWSFYVDRSPPTISMEALAPYNARSPTTIRYTASDEVSPNLLSVRCDLYDANDNFVINIATADALAKGDNFFTWNGLATGDSRPVTDGNYKMKIKAFDLAGNSAVAEQPIVIDSTPPVVARVDVSPNPMTSNSTQLGLTARVNEKSTVIIKLINTTNNSTTAYLTQGIATRDSEPATASYAWKYDDMFTKGPEDGIYRIEVIARDDAGNESAPRTLEAVRIDRTPPAIYGEIANPYVLSNIGANAYKTTLSYSLAGAEKVKIKVYNSNTGQCVQTIYPDISNTATNSVPWNGGDPSFGKGAYKFQIIAEDDVGNVGMAYASCVKDGIAPEISFPAEDGVEVSGAISIRGTAMDPDWTNDKPFKNYRVFYKKTGEDWKTESVEVPLTNREPNGPKNVSIRPLQNDSALAYLYTNAMENGEYTIKVEVNEEGGETLSATRVIKVNNDSLTASSIQAPYIKLKVLPSSVEFKSDDSVKLSLGFINSVKPANVYVEIVRPSSSEGVVFSKYFPNVIGAPFIGKPDYKPGVDIGYFIWSDDAGYHLRWSADGSNHKFTGSVVLVGSGGYTDIKQSGGGIKVQSPLISWDTAMSGGEGGVDFKVAAGQLMITAKIDEDPSSPAITADNVYLGLSKYSQQYLPIIIDVAGQRLLNIANMGATTSSSAAQGPLSADWDGKYVTGGYVDNGTYIIRVRAEGADGLGIATDEALVDIKTPFELTNLTVAPADKNFSTLGGLDRITVSYNISKDSLINAYVYEGDQLKCTLANGKQALGTTNPNNPLTLTWKGNYPDPDSGQMVPGGTYKIRLIASARDGSASTTQDIDNISITKFSQGAGVSLSPVGKEVDFNNGNGIENIRLASGDSPFYYEAKGSGWYHPPKDFSYTLTATGEQRLTAYPYVPFAALMHRGFNRVKVRVIASAEGSYYDSYFDANPLHFGWQVTDLQHFSNVPRFSKDFDLTTGITSFELLENSSSDDVLGAPNGANQPSKRFQDVGVVLAFCAQDDPSLVLDKVVINSEDLHDPTTEAVMSKLSEKGIFRIFFKKSPIENETTYVTVFMGVKIPIIINNEYNHQEDYRYRYRVDVKLEAPIEYSRLTNRFVPWIGFASKGHPAKEANDFSGYLDNLDKLGFPGKSYFMGATSNALDAPHRGSFEAQLFTANPAALSMTLNVNGLALAKPQADSINLKTSSGLTGTASDYSSYLADEYLEFIPITAPYKGGFEYNGSPVNDKLALSKQASYAFLAKTDIVYPYNGAGGGISPFKFSWPWNNSELTAFNSQHGTKRKTLVKELGGNPQNYTGPTADGTFWELDPTEVTQRRMESSNRNSFSGLGQTRFDKAVNKSLWSTTESFGQLLPLPNYVDADGAQYIIASNTSGIVISPALGGKNDRFQAEDADWQGVAWTTADDLNLLQSNGAICSPSLTYNEKEFKGTRTLNLYSSYQLNHDDYSSVNALKYAFLQYDPFGRDMNITPIDNPNVVINNWEVKVKDRTGNSNPDFQPAVIQMNDQRLHDTLTLKLKLNATEARYVELTGEASGPYELSYFDGSAWKTIFQSIADKPASGRLAWWDVSRLNGKYTVLLRSGNFVSSQDVQIGTLVKKEGGDAFSAYKRAQLKFPDGAFASGANSFQDQIVTITPVTMNQIYIRNRPILITAGPIVEIKPSPYRFAVGTVEGDRRPTLKFVYTFDDLAELKVDTSKISGTVGEVAKELMLPWNIHQVTAAGDLQIVSDNHQTVEENNGEKHYVFYAALDHFSTYALLPGSIHLSAPMVFADSYITNKDSVSIYGSAEPNSLLNLFIKKDNVPPDVAKGDRAVAQAVAKDKSGDYRFENVSLLPDDGSNYLFVTSSLEGGSGVETWGDVTIVKDTVAPSVEVGQNLYAFSPNGDGKYDSVDYLLKSNEKGRLYLSVSSLGSRVMSQLINKEISVEANKEVKLTWTKDGFDLYRRDATTGDRRITVHDSLAQNFTDGIYSVTVYSIDEAGNISNNVINQTTVDTSPPAVLGLNADPNPFTPNDDGIKETTKFWYKFSEPVHVSTNILRDDGVLFRTYEGTTENFTYPTEVSGGRGRVASAGDWTWDGKGSRNELVGDTYSYSIVAEDNVGNSTTSEVKQIVVDRTPTLIPYALAQPDPFAPVNPDNNFTEIKYYLGRDNLKTKVIIVGQGGRTLKTLVNDEVQSKGEHSARWYGDFDTTYDGPTALANKYRVGDSSYQFKVMAEDINESGSKTAEVSSTVLVDNTPPQILIRSLNIDAGKNEAALVYSVPENTSVEAYLFDQDNNLIATLATSEAKLPGEYRLSYISSSESGLVGRRYFKLIATDLAKNKTEARSDSFDADPNRFRVTNFNAAPAIFSPNGDGIDDQTRISYKLAGGLPDYQVNVNIMTQTGSNIRSLVVNDPEAPGTYSFYWDGKADNGQLAPDGYYDCSIAGSDKNGATSAGKGSVLLVATRPTVNISTSVPVISPNGDGYNDSVVFNCSISYPIFYLTGEALVKVDVLNSTGEAVWSKTFNRTPGAFTYEWDGSYGDGSGKVPSGQYSARIMGEDSMHTTAFPMFASFEVETGGPVVSISNDAGLIADPGNFSTNADPGGSDRPRTTNFYYQVDKDASLTVKVHKIDDSQTSYACSNFNDANLVATLVSAEPVIGGAQQSVVWDGKITSNSSLYDLNNDGYADPGKYAFIVEGKDGQNISTVNKCGGTVWVQNNVVTLKNPDQYDFANNGTATPEVNPTPHYISPNGNSTAESQRRARLYFMATLSLTPEAVRSPEKIAAQTVSGAYTKKIGQYSINVYSDSGLTNLVRTITLEADAWSASLLYEDWDGKNAAGQLVADGTYYMVVSLKDFAGNLVGSLTQPVVVDNMSPTVSNLSTSNYYFNARNQTADPARQTTTISYEVGDNSQTVNTTIDILRAGVHKAFLQNPISQEANVKYSKLWSGEGYDIDGTYTYRIIATDQAGNTASAEGLAVLDQTAPIGSVTINNGNAYTTLEPVSLGLSYSDATSGMEQMCFSGDGYNWTTWESPSASKPWTLSGGDGSKAIWVKYSDKSGNYTTNINGAIILDKTPPVFNSGPSVSGMPVNSWTQLNKPTFTFNCADAGSGFKEARGYIDGVDQGPINSGWSPTLSEGANTVALRAFDNAGLFADSSVVTFEVDTTAPNAPSVSVSNSVTGSFTNQNKPIFTWIDPGDGNGSGVNHYRGYIDNVDQGNVAPGWQPTLSQGTHNIYIRAVDGVGLTKDSAAFMFEIDMTAPQITGNSVNYQIISPANHDGQFDVSTITYRVNKTCAVSIRLNGVTYDQGTRLAGTDYTFDWSPSLPDGPYTYEFRLIDTAGNDTGWTSGGTITVDNTPPAISNVTFSPKSAFVDGVSNSVTIWCNVSPLGSKADLKIMDGDGNQVRKLAFTFVDMAPGSVNWDLKNESGVLVPIGKYSFNVTASDSVLNSVTIPSSGKIRVKSRDEVIMVDDNGSRDEDVRISKFAKDSKSFSSYYWTAADNLHGSSAAGDYLGDGKPLFATLNASNVVKIFDPRTQTLISSFSLPNEARLAACDYDGDGKKEIVALGSDGWIRIYNYSGSLLKSFQSAGNELAAGDFAGDGHDSIVTVAKGGTSVYLFDPRSIGNGASGNNYYASWSAPLTVRYVACGDMNGDGKAEIVISAPISIMVCQNNYFLYNASGSLFNTLSFTDSTAFSYVTVGDYAGNGHCEVAAMAENNLDTWMYIFNPLASSWSAACLCGHGVGGDCCSYPSSEDVLCSYDGTAAYSIKNIGLATKSAALELPILLTPTNGMGSVQSIRPTFEWQHHTGGTTNYQVDVAKNDSFSIAHQIFTKSPNTGSPDKADPSLCNFTYAINEFDPGLDKDTYYWKVTALATSDAATSEVWSFSIAPDLTLTDVTNYPNPFNPNKEKTKFRYRLSTDASDVKIRIYDITGALVNELDGSTNGESSSIWGKYNDIEWDGRNGRGDVVMNGIYPFEVDARLGDKSVAGRGKIAVLK